jgi:hypothetical protein
MTIDWFTVGIAAASALVTALLQRSTTGTSPSTTAPTRQGLLARLFGGSQASSSSSSSGSTGHPILDALTPVLQSLVAQNPQLQQLEGLVVQLIHPSGSVNVNISKGGTTNAQSPAAAKPANPPAAPSA